MGVGGCICQDRVGNKSNAHIVFMILPLKNTWTKITVASCSYEISFFMIAVFICPQVPEFSQRQYRSFVREREFGKIYRTSGVSPIYRLHNRGKSSYLS